MNWTGKLWDKLQSLGFVVFAAIVVCAIALLFLPLLSKRRDMQRELAQLDGEISRQGSLEAKQKTEIEALRTDKAFLERTTRDKLNLARPNETIFRFETAPAPRR